MKEKIQKKYRLYRMNNSDEEITTNFDPNSNEQLQELVNMEPIYKEYRAHNHGHKHHINGSKHRHRIYKHYQNNTYTNKKGRKVYKKPNGTYSYKSSRRSRKTRRARHVPKN